MMHILGLGTMSYYFIALEHFIWEEFLSIKMKNDEMLHNNDSSGGKGQDGSGGRGGEG